MPEDQAIERLECPVKHENINNKPDDKICSSVEVDERNQMFKNDPQKPWPGQRIGLEKDRVISKIPKAKIGSIEEDKEETWIYPSEQQFFNALKRKGWENTEEKDMKSVVSIHNHVNDIVWDKVMEYEKLHCKKCPNPKLLKFLGRPKDKSPKALFKSTLLGYKDPFDRHDWTVDRCGKEVRYVIDFYSGEMNPNQKANGQVGFYVDVRPALDSFQALSDRIKHYFLPKP